MIFWKFYFAMSRLQTKFLKHFKTTSKPRLKFKWGQEKEGLPNLQLLDNKTLLRSLFVFNDSVITLQRTIPLSKFMMSMVTSVKAELWEQSYKSRLKDTCTLKKGPQRRDKKRSLKIELVLRIPFSNNFLAKSSYVFILNSSKLKCILRQNQAYFSYNIWLEGDRKKVYSVPVQYISFQQVP